MPTETVVLTSADGVRLEGRLSVPERARGGAILCHPHPEYGGSMSSALIPALQRALEAAGWAALRFNFRGVGRSGGVYGGGSGEVLDATAALDRIAAAVPGLPLAVAGWSFGALVGLAAAVADARAVAYVGIAPPVSVGASLDLPVLPPAERVRAWPGRALLACGTDDAFSVPEDVRRWAAEILPNARVDVFDGEDHFFSGARAELAATVAAFIAGD